MTLIATSPAQRLDDRAQNENRQHDVPGEPAVEVRGHFSPSSLGGSWFVPL